jgi:hypothetical protein
MRIALGLVASTLATPLAIAVAWFVLWYAQVDWFDGKPLAAVTESIRLYSMLSAPVALFITVAAGGPVAHQLAYRGHPGLTKCLLLGAVLGALPFLVFEGYIMGTNLLLYVTPAPGRENVMTALRWAGLGSWCGMCSATAYWTIAIRGRQ